VHARPRGRPFALGSDFERRPASKVGGLTELAAARALGFLK